jgi:hypothetical protein
MFICSSALTAKGETHVPMAAEAGQAPNLRLPEQSRSGKTAASQRRKTKRPGLIRVVGR